MKPSDAPHNQVISRRAFLGTATTLGLAALATTLPGCGTQAGPSPVIPDPVVPTSPPFVQPEVRRSVNGLLDTTLHVRYATCQVNGQPANLRTYEGTFCAPTLRVKPGDTLRVNIVNELPPNPDQSTVYPDHNTPNRSNSTNLHTHGLHVSPSNNSDNVFVEITPGSSFQYEYHIPADHPSGTYWYHPHRHGSTSVQLFSGMAGALIIEGGLDQRPEVQAARDLVFLINELNIDPGTNQVPEYTSNGVFSGGNNHFTVNGQTMPTLTCQPGEVVRLRIINGTVRHNVPFAIDGHDLELVAMDGINLPAQRFVTAGNGVELAPGNRGDVFVRAGAPGTYAIHKLADSTASGTAPDVIIAQLVVTGTPLSMLTPLVLPQEPSLPSIQASEITGRRTLTFAVGGVGPPLPAPAVGNFSNFTIATDAGPGQRFDPQRVDHTIPLNAVEEWTLVNTSNVGHPFHIHVNDFQVVEINGVAQPTPEWRDTIMIPKRTGATNGSVKIRTRFVDFTGLFVLHCHILPHEDVGMMQSINII